MSITFIEMAKFATILCVRMGLPISIRDVFLGQHRDDYGEAERVALRSDYDSFPNA